MVKRRRPVIAGNWKMNKVGAEARAFAQEFREKAGGITDVDMVVCAPFTCLHVLKEELEESVIHIGAQNMFYEGAGAYTGEVSAAMLQDLSCTFVIIGHSERREILKEIDENIALKVKVALAENLTPILCVGESLTYREAGKAIGYVRGQVEKDLADLSSEELRRVVVAYEPIWAIGTGKTASAADAQEMCGAIRSTIAGFAGAVAEEVRILYGGSVKSSNIAELMKQADIDGALVGGASLQAGEFVQLIQNARGMA